jgi:hypothetical protein
MESDAQYHNAELVLLASQVAKVASQPLADRKAAEDDCYQVMQNPAIVAERIGWCLDGNYGYGAMVQMRRIAFARRGNRPAQAMQLIAALEWACPQGHCIKAWKRLTREEREALDYSIKIEMDRFKAE